MIKRTPQRGMKVSLFDLMILMVNIYKAQERADIGFEDADHTLSTLTASLGSKMMIELGDVESALWSCNLLHEKDAFWHPKGLTFKQYTAKLIGPGNKFNERYNWVD